MQMLGRETIFKVVTVIVRTVCENHPSPPSPQNGVTTNLRLGTVCGVLVDYAEAEVAKYERSMWKILVRLKKFTKV